MRVFPMRLRGFDFFKVTHCNRGGSKAAVSVMTISTLGIPLFVVFAYL